MKILTNLVLAAALSGCVGEDAGIESEPRCATITGLGVYEINNEISSLINEAMGFGFCTNIRSSLAAREKCAITSPYDGDIILDPRMYLNEGQLFVKIAHEYGHIFYNHINEREYTEALLAWDNCVYMPRFNEMEMEADYFAGYIVAASGKRSDDGLAFVTDTAQRPSRYPTSCQLDDLPVCVSEYYTNEQRADVFMNGYNQYHEDYPDDE